MILSQAVEQYILHKRLLGARFRGEASQLRAFTKAIGDCDMHLVKPELVLRFLEGTGSVTSFWFTKYHTLNSSIATLLPVSTVQGAPLSVLHAPEPFEPYIYTNRDIEQLVDAADALRQRYYFGRGIEPHAIRTLLLLLYGTGLRISEALSLTLSDFDTDASVLTIRQTKFFKSRFVPVGPDLSGVLRRYIDRQWSGRLCTEATPLLGNRKGVPLTRNAAELVFKGLRQQAGVYRSKDARYQPRLHDFRAYFRSRSPRYLVPRRQECPAAPAPPVYLPWTWPSERDATVSHHDDRIAPRGQPLF